MSGSRVRAWLRECAEPGWIVLLIAAFVLFAAVMLSPGVPGPTIGPPPTVGAGVMDPVYDDLEQRVYTLERENETLRRWIEDLERQVGIEAP